MNHKTYFVEFENEPKSNLLFSTIKDSIEKDFLQSDQYIITNKDDLNQTIDYLMHSNTKDPILITFQFHKTIVLFQIIIISIDSKKFSITIEKCDMIKLKEDELSNSYNVGDKNE